MSSRGGGDKFHCDCRNRIFLLLKEDLELELEPYQQFMFSDIELMSINQFPSTPRIQSWLWHWAYNLNFLSNEFHLSHQLHKYEYDMDNTILHCLSRQFSYFPPIRFLVLSLACIINFYPINCKAPIIDAASNFQICGVVKTTLNMKKCHSRGIGVL